MRQRLPETILIDLSVFLAYTFKDDELHPNAERLISEVEEKQAEKPSLYISECVPYEAEALFLSGKAQVPIHSWTPVVSRLWQDPLFPRLPASSRVYAEHLRYYRGTGGRFTYFDSFHAATSKVSGIPLVTNDGDLLAEPSITTIDLAKV